jgi:hypothetical protein
VTVEVFDVGDHVECDMCSTDFTGKPDPGGLLFGSYAVCPRCAPRIEADAKLDGEERFIKARCPEGMAFAAWVLSLRQGDNTIRFYTGDDADDLMFGRRQ